jgi:O-antigen/teichoic acid export membrane protein
MKRQVSLKKNFIMNAILTMSSFIFPLITFPYISRILLPEGTGKVSFATSVVSYFALFAQLGIPTYGIRACAQVRDNKEELSRVTQELLIINLITSVFAYAVLAVVLIAVPRFRTDRILYLIISVTILMNAISMEWLYKGLEQYTYITVRSIAFKAAAVMAMFLLVHQKSDYVIYGAISVFASSASSIMNFIHARKLISLRPVGNYNYRRHMKAIGVFFAMSCATVIYTNLDKVMLGFMATDTDVGYYDAAVKIKSILVSVVTSLGTVLLPRASFYVEKGLMKEFHRITSKAIEFVWLVAAPLTVYFIFFAAQGVHLLSGSAYDGAILPMQVLMPTLLFIGLSNITGIQVLIPIGKEKVVLYSEIAGALTDLILNAIFIPRIQSSGAAIGTLVAEFVVLLVQYRAIRKDIRPIFLKIPYGKLLLAMMLATAASCWTLFLPLSFGTTIDSLIVLLLSACCFFAVYFLVLYLEKEPLVHELTGQMVNKLRSSKKNER